jgi:hypothetical protein
MEVLADLPICLVIARESATVYEHRMSADGHFDVKR